MNQASLLQTATKVTNTLRAAGIRFAVAGGCAVYARGGPPSDHDVDIFLKEADTETARTALVAEGMRPVDPPEDWLTKVYNGNCLVDLVFRPNYRPVTDDLLDRADPLRIGSTTAPVLDATDLVIDKLLVLGPHRCDFTPLLAIVRAVREQVDWPSVRKETAESPYAKAFLWLVAALDIAETRLDG